MGLACRKSELGAAVREAKSVYEGRPGHWHIVIGGGLAAVSGTRAARHPERYAVFVGSRYRAGAFEVEAAYPPGSPPTVNGTTPRYPGELQHDDIPVPEVLRAH